MPNRMFFDCNICKTGNHHECPHGAHEWNECKCVENPEEDGIPYE